VALERRSLYNPITRRFVSLLLYSQLLQPMKSTNLKLFFDDTEPTPYPKKENALYRGTSLCEGGVARFGAPQERQFSTLAYRTYRCLRGVGKFF
jgi:hypothetical protein